ncbi:MULTISPECIES: hypothetical protein [unclassified Mesorhizobium]|uniref:ISAzo13-like element transposase-related protein n=1 Tax=unclassified Mesorhizobium TaxID=325217 RepID=UPI003335583B
MRWARRSSNWTSFSSRWARAWGGHEVVDLAVGRLALHYAEENPDEVVAALCGPTRPSSTPLATRPTEVGLVVRVRLDRRRYPIGKNISKKELRELKVECEEFHGEWDYVIRSRMERRI